MIAPNEFIWEQRGRIDFIIGTSFGNSPAETLFERDEWEKGWQAGFEAAQRRILRVNGASLAALSTRMPETK